MRKNILLLIVIITLVCGGLLSDTEAQICTTPLTTAFVDATSGVDLPGNIYGTDVVAAGAYVMVLFKTATGYYSQFSFNHGVDFPSWTKRRIPTISASAALSLYSDGRDVIAVGKDNNGMRNYEFSFGDFTWRNGTQIFAQILPAFSCTAKRGLFICAVGGSDQVPPVADGIQVYTLNTASTNRTSAIWSLRFGDSLPEIKVQPTLASDGTTVMICAVGNLDGFVHLICAASATGTTAYINTQKPLPDILPDTTPAKLASNGVLNSYVVAFIRSNKVETRMTTNLGGNWTVGAQLFPGLTTIPPFLTYTDKFTSLFVQSGKAFLTFQNNSSPVQWGASINIINSTEVSFTTGGFSTNFHIAYKTATNQIVCSSCIPSASPTFAPSPSPTKSAATGAEVQGLVQYYMAVLLLLIVYF
jgi:hypothetical protein